MTPFATRREVPGTLLSATVGGIPYPPSKYDDTKSSDTVHARPNFEAVRYLILQAIAHGEATGVVVAVAHGGSIVWEESFGWANREAALKVTPRTCPIDSKTDTLTFYISGVYVEAIGVKTEDKFDLPQATLGLRIIRVVVLGSIHGYAVAQRIKQMSRLPDPTGILYPVAPTPQIQGAAGFQLATVGDRP